MSIMMGEIVGNGEKLARVEEELHDTHELVADLSERAVPVLENLEKLEVFMLFAVGTVVKVEDGTVKVVPTYYMRGVQEASVSSAKSRTKKQFGGTYCRLLHVWRNTPNTIMLKQKAREKMGNRLRFDYNTIYPAAGVTDNEIVQCFNEIYLERLDP